MLIDSLNETSVILGSLAAIIGTLAGLFKWLSTTILKAIQNTIANDLLEITSNTRQLIPNGGTHLADSINRLEVNQAKTGAEVEAIAQAFREHQADHRVK